MLHFDAIQLSAREIHDQRCKWILEIWFRFRNCERKLTCSSYKYHPSERVTPDMEPIHTPSRCEGVVVWLCSCFDVLISYQYAKILHLLSYTCNALLFSEIQLIISFYVLRLCAIKPATKKFLCFYVRLYTQIFQENFNSFVFALNIFVADTAKTEISFIFVSSTILALYSIEKFYPYTTILGTFAALVQDIRT